MTASLIMVSCVKDDPVEILDDGTAWHEKPDMSLMSAELTLYDDENDPITATATKADFWTDESRAELTDFSFEQKDRDGNVTMRGCSDKALVDTETNEFELLGSIVLESVRDGLRISAEGSVTFNADTEEIDAPGVVQVSNDGSSFSGRGFYGNLRKEEYSFDEIMEGRFDV